MDNIYESVKKEIIIQIGYLIEASALPQNIRLEKINAEITKK